MPWNDTARDQHNRDHLRYPNDLTDRAWALIAPMLPAATRALEGREASPTAGVTDSHGVKTTEAGEVCGYAGSRPTAASATF